MPAADGDHLDRRVRAADSTRFALNKRSTPRLKEELNRYEPLTFADR